MKKLLITIVVLGLVLLCVGKIMMELDHSDNKENNIGLDSSTEITNSEFKDGFEIIDKEIDDIENIKLDLGHYSVRVKRDNNISNVRVSAKKPIIMKSNTDINKLDMIVKDKTLIIEENHKDYSDKLNLFNQNTRKGELVIKVPSNYNLSEIKISCGVGNINIDSFKIAALSIESGTAAVELNNLLMEKCMISTGTGKVNVEDSICGDLNIESGAGKIEFDGDVTKSAMISTGTGQIDVELDGKQSEYNFVVSSGTGRKEINDYKYSKDVNINSSSSIKVQIESGTGSIDIETD